SGGTNDARKGDDHHQLADDETVEDDGVSEDDLPQSGALDDAEGEQAGDGESRRHPPVDLGDEGGFRALRAVVGGGSLPGIERHVRVPPGSVAGGTVTAKTAWR